MQFVWALEPFIFWSGTTGTPKKSLDEGAFELPRKAVLEKTRSEDAEALYLHLILWTLTSMCGMMVGGTIPNDSKWPHSSVVLAVLGSVNWRYSLISRTKDQKEVLMQATSIVQEWGRPAFSHELAIYLNRRQHRMITLISYWQVIAQQSPFIINNHYEYLS